MNIMYYIDEFVTLVLVLDLVVEYLWVRGWGVGLGGSGIMGFLLLG